MLVWGLLDYASFVLYMLFESKTCGGRRSSMITCGYRVDFLFSEILVPIWISLTYVVGSEELGFFHGKEFAVWRGRR